MGRGRMMGAGRAETKEPNPKMHAAPTHTVSVSSAHSMAAETTSMI